MIAGKEFDGEGEEEGRGCFRKYEWWIKPRWGGAACILGAGNFRGSFAFGNARNEVCGCHRFVVASGGDDDAGVRG